MATQLKAAGIEQISGYNLEAEKEMVGRARELQPLLRQHCLLLLPLMLLQQV